MTKKKNVRKRKPASKARSKMSSKSMKYTSKKKKTRGASLGSAKKSKTKNKTVHVKIGAEVKENKSYDVDTFREVDREFVGAYSDHKREESYWEIQRPKDNIGTISLQYMDHIPASVPFVMRETVIKKSHEYVPPCKSEDKDLCLMYGEKEVRDFLPEKIYKDKRVFDVEHNACENKIDNIAKSFAKAFYQPDISDDISSLGIICHDYYKGGNVLVIIDDYTMSSVHTRSLLPLLFTELEKFKIGREKVMILIASGRNPAPQTESEFIKILGKDLFNSIRSQVITHDVKSNLTSLGRLSETEGEIQINKSLINADFAVVLTNLRHGYLSETSGGVASICPGIVSDATMKTYCPSSRFGVTLPTQMDVTKFITKQLQKKGIRIYAITCVTTPCDELAYIDGGEIYNTHSRALTVLDEMYSVRLKKEVDVAIVSALNIGDSLMQSVPAFVVGKQLVKKGGVVCVLAPLRGALGAKLFATVLDKYITRFKELDLLSEDESLSDKQYVDRSQKILREILKDLKTSLQEKYIYEKELAYELLQVIEYCGWGNVMLITDGLLETDAKKLPFYFPGRRSDTVQKRLVSLITDLEEEGKKTYCILEDPSLMVKVG